MEEEKCEKEEEIEDSDNTIKDNEKEKDSIDHYTYHGVNNYTVQPFIIESEPSSPILSAWPTSPLNPDYLAPYHPSVHKSIHNWSQTIVRQVQRKNESGNTHSTTSTPVNTVNNGLMSIHAALASGIVAASPSAFKGVSVLPPPGIYGTKAGGVKVEKHFLFQTHHRERQPDNCKQQCVDNITTPRKRHHRRRIRRSISKPFKRLARFIKQILASIKNGESKSKNDQAPPNTEEPSTHAKINTKLSVGNSTDGTLNYLPVSDDEDERQLSLAFEEQSQEKLEGTIKGIPKLMKVIDQIVHNAKQGKELEGVDINDKNPRASEQAHDASIEQIQQPSSSTTSTTSTSSTSSSPQQQQQQLQLQPFIGNNSQQGGPRMHPKLLELYEVTDHVLGEGTFATVKEIKLKSTGQSFALKIILKKLFQGKFSMLDTEIAVLSKVRHPNCVSLLEMFETEDAVYLVTDLAEGGELFDQLLKKGNYTEGDAARLVREILLGVEYLHSMDIVHRDLKPENLLFLDKSENARLLITDFGLSKILTNGNDVLMTACGTPGYVAPEVLEQVGHGKPVDMWSVGIIAYTLLCGYTPFWGEDQMTLFQNIISGSYHYENEYWKDVSPLAKKFIDTLLVREVDKRATATQALSHPWFRAMLDQDLAAPASPSDSVNLLPGVRKNFNAGNMFKKAIQAVGILRRMQATQVQHRQGHPSRTNANSPGRSPLATSSTTRRSQKEEGSGSGTEPRPKNASLKFHQVVGAAVLANQGARIDPVSNVDEQEKALESRSTRSEGSESALNMLDVE